MNKRREIPTLLGLIIIAVAIVIFFGGTFTYEHFAIKEFERVIKPENQTTGFPMQILATKGWKTYTNAQYGFEFKYPENWQLWEMNKVSGLVRIYPNSKSEQAINKTISLTDEITFSVADSLYGGETQQVNIGDTVWLSAITSDVPPYCDGCTEKVLSYISAINNNKYIGVSTGISNKEVLLKILSTFKFTK
jgi:hypothetical protein